MSKGAEGWLEPEASGLLSHLYGGNIIGSIIGPIRHRGIDRRFCRLRARFNNWSLGATGNNFVEGASVDRFFDADQVSDRFGAAVYG